MPVLPEVGSTIVPPGFSRPSRSAASTIASPIRSLIDPPGLARSDLIHTSASGPNSRLTRTCGVLPMVSSMVRARMANLRWCCHRNLPPNADAGYASTGYPYLQRAYAYGRHPRLRRVAAGFGAPPPGPAHDGDAPHVIRVLQPQFPASGIDEFGR